MRLHIEWNQLVATVKLGTQNWALCFFNGLTPLTEHLTVHTPKFPDPKQHQKLVTLIDSSDTFPLLTYNML